MTGPGIVPSSLMKMFCRPRARDLSCSLTHLSVAMVEGMVTQKVRKMRMKLTTTKGMNTPHSLSHCCLIAEPESPIQLQLVKLL